MILTFFFAQLLGLLLIILGVSLFVHRKMYMGMLAAYRENRATYYPLGYISLIVGLTFVLLHNVWTGGLLPLLVTIVSWLIFLKGAAFLLVPDRMLKRLEGPFSARRTYRIVAISMLVVGIYLLLAGSGGR